MIRSGRDIRIISAGSRGGGMIRHPEVGSLDGGLMMCGWVGSRTGPGMMLWPNPSQRGATGCLSLRDRVLVLSSIGEGPSRSCNELRKR